ncbi:MAG: dynamin family protein [Terriglobales bacterium]
MANTSAGVLNAFQQRRLRVTLQEADRLLTDIEAILNASASKSPFPKYLADLAPGQRKTIEDHIDRIRARLVRLLEGQGISSEAPSIPASRAITTALEFVEIAVEELAPRYMRGYGEVPPSAAAELNGIVGELSALVRQLQRYVTQGGEDLQNRLQRLERAGADVEVVTQLERIISEHGLVEFRSTLSMIVDRLEDTTFEVAVFGRVSSGKSSLLNAVLGTDVLPVGVTPITAVPTRLMFSEDPVVLVWFPDRGPEGFGLEKLAEFVSERNNPGNTKHVARIIAALPSSRLREGVVFVDTPGLGSLAASGAAETLAYLPRCDLGVILIDAASSLSPDDLRTIEALYEGGVPASILLSKADLLAPQDLERVLAYTKEHIRSNLGLELSVTPMSVMASHRQLLDRWFEGEIVPLFDRRQELRTASVHRKVGALRQSVEAALKARLRRTQHPSQARQSELHSIEAGLRHATGEIEAATRDARRRTEEIEAISGTALERAADVLLAQRAGNASGLAESQRIVRDTVVATVQERAKELHGLFELLSGRLLDALNTAATSLDLPDRPKEDEFLGILREMPIFDVALGEFGIGRSPFANILGRRYAKQQLVARLKRAVGDQVFSATATYSRVLGEWSRNVLGKFQRHFAAYADAYRAQAERVYGARDVGSNEQRALEMDLELLGALHGAGEAAVEHVSDVNTK